MARMRKSIPRPAKAPLPDTKGMMKKSPKLTSPLAAPMLKNTRARATKRRVKRESFFREDAPSDVSDPPVHDLVLPVAVHVVLDLVLETLVILQAL